MARPLPLKLRERAMARIAVGESVRMVASALNVSPSSVVKWSQRKRATGNVAPGRMGGHVPPKIAGEHRAWLIERAIAAPFTLRGLVGELAERGLKVDYRTMWKFIHVQGLGFERRRAAQQAAPTHGRKLNERPKLGSRESNLSV